jgi:hypothetical protein
MGGLKFGKANWFIHYASIATAAPRVLDILPAPMEVFPVEQGQASYQCLLLSGMAIESAQFWHN